MYNYNKVIEGLMTFVDKELIPKMEGYQRWVFGTACGIMGKKCEKIYESLKDVALLKTLDVLDGEQVNVDLLYEELAKQASKSPVTIEIPMLGTIRLDKSDVDKLHRYITGGSYGEHV